jgi:hypothetical protein
VVNNSVIIIYLVRHQERFEVRGTFICHRGQQKKDRGRGHKNGHRGQNGKPDRGKTRDGEGKARDGKGEAREADEGKENLMKLEILESKVGYRSERIARLPARQVAWVRSPVPARPTISVEKVVFYVTFT